MTALVCSVGLFANQSIYTGPIPQNFPEVGDITFAVGFVLAASLYAALTRRPAREPAA